MFRVLLVCFAFIVLTGCATIRPSTWYNNKIADTELRERQKAVDDAHCSLVAEGSVPMPEFRVYTSAQQQQIYQINTNVVTTGPHGTYTSRVYGTVTAGPAPSFAQGFSDGYAVGSAIKERLRAKELRTKTYVSCMYKLGWTEQPPGTIEKPLSGRVLDAIFGGSSKIGDEGSACTKNEQCGPALLCRNSICTDTLKDVPPAPPYP
jgi:hypothetical protein